MVELTRSYEGSGRLLYLDCQLTEDNHKEGKETQGLPKKIKIRIFKFGQFFVILVLRTPEHLEFRLVLFGLLLHWVIFEVDQGQGLV